MPLQETFWAKALRPAHSNRFGTRGWSTAKRRHNCVDVVRSWMVAMTKSRPSYPSRRARLYLNRYQRSESLRDVLARLSKVVCCSIVHERSSRFELSISLRMARAVADPRSVLENKSADVRERMRISERLLSTTLESMRWFSRQREIVQNRPALPFVLIEIMWFFK
jgi:hypothetical protein